MHFDDKQYLRQAIEFSKTRNQIWPFGIDISAQEVIERSNSNITLIGPTLEAETDLLFMDAKTYQAKMNKAHPAQGVLSNELSDFYEATL